MTERKIKELIEIAIGQLAYSYTPYSHFRVGSALLGKNGMIYTGCNIENAAYTPTNCAERTALFKAVSEGVHDFEAICIVGGPNGRIEDFTPPCGVCRQVMMEFCLPEEFQIILAKGTEDYRIFKLKDFMPMGFGPGNLEERQEKNETAKTDICYCRHISESVEDFQIPTLQKLGLANLTPLRQVPEVARPLGYQAVLKEKSNGKDTMTGHWEIMGIETKKPFKTFTEHGFPKELIGELEKRTGHKVIGNKSASGTEIIEELGEEEIATGHMIVYTSADSVMQICGNEETFGLEELYRCCKIARELTMREEWRVGRVIARPYIGKKKGEFERTSNRHDYALKPPMRTALDVLQDHGFDVISVGKIRDIFDGEGITKAYKSKSSIHGMEQTNEIAGKDFHGLCFVNLVDFDAKWGHRRDPEGYAKELEQFDKGLSVLLETLREDDLLIITADHGNDPTYTGTDHTREKVPFLAYSKSMEGGGRLSEQDTFAVIGATILDNFGLSMPEGTIGASLLGELK